MRLCCFSDTHGLVLPHTEPHDITIYAGDWTSFNDYKTALAVTKQFLLALSSLSTCQILVAGNHDLIPACHYNLFKELISEYPSIHYLENSSITINSIEFYGTPYTPVFMDWYFMKTELALEQLYDQIPTTTNVLITHGPAYGIRDCTKKEISAGSSSLLDAISNLPELKHHIFGHIHEGYGTTILPSYSAHNVAILNYNYKPVNLPIYINI